MSAERRIAIIGAGRMGRCHFEACRRLADAGIHVNAVVDPSPGVRDSFRRAGIDVSEDVAELDAGTQDVVVVATPSDTHLGMLEKLEGFHGDCLLEKPGATNASGFVRLLEMVPDSSMRLRVGFWRRWSPTFRALREAVRSGEIGVPRYVLAAQWDAVPPELARQDPSKTGGIGIDCGVHETDTVRWLGCGALQRLSVGSPPDCPDVAVAIGDSDQLVASGTTDAGVAVSVSISRTAGGVDEIFYKVIGSRGSAELRVGLTSTLTLRSASGAEVVRVLGANELEVSLARQLEALLTKETDIEMATAVDAARAAAPWLPLNGAFRALAGRLE